MARGLSSSSLGLLAVAVAVAAGSNASLADASSGFDAELLRQRGIDPSLVALLSEEARFTPGQHRVGLRVNDQSRGRVEARFDQQGQLCFDSTLLEAAGLRLPDDSAAGCQDFLERYSQAQVKLDPQTETVSLVVPTEALRPVERQQDLSVYHTGGMAGIVNYDVSGLRNRYDGSSRDYWSANTEVGFNAGDWIVRSRQVHSVSQGVRRSEFLDGYAQRTFAGLGTVLQAGQINLVNPVLAGARVEGVQVSTEQALNGPVRRNAVEGLAQSQARVEVRQAGTLIYSTVVPAGPFKIDNLPQLDRLTDLEVTVIEADGAQHGFTVPAAMVSAEVTPPGFSVGAGRLRETGGEGAEPWVVSAGWTQSLNASTSLSVGMLASDGYQAAGVGVGMQPWLGSTMQWRIQAADASEHGKRGLQSQVSMSQKLNPQWSVNASYSQQTQGYRELLDGVSARDEVAAQGRSHSQHSLGVSWNHATVGSLSSGFSRTDSQGGAGSSRAYASWNRRFGAASVSVSAERNLGGNSRTGDAVYASVTLPIGTDRSLRASVRESNGASRVGVTMQERVSDTLSYRLGSERDGADGSVNLNAGVSALPRHTQLDLNYASNGGGSRSLGMGLRGGMAVHGDGITFSPYAVKDTFALVSVGELSGVRLDTPAGPVWTDGDGQALVAQLAPYGKSAVEIQPRSLPRNVDLDNSVEHVQAGRGAVPKVDFRVTSTRRVLLQASDAQGNPLPGGATVTDGDGEFVTLVQEGGLIFAHNVQASPKLWVKVADAPACELHFELPESADLQAYYETATAACRSS